MGKQRCVSGQPAKFFKAMALHLSGERRQNLLWLPFTVYLTFAREKADECLKLRMMHAIFKLFLSETFNVSCGLEMA